MKRVIRGCLLTVGVGVMMTMVHLHSEVLLAVPTTTTTTGPGVTTDTVPPPRVNSQYNRTGLRLIFVMGIEGTGHHLFQQLTKDSPATRQSITFRIPSQNYDLQNMLMRTNSMSLFGSPCAFKAGRESTYPEIVNVIQSMAAAVPTGESLSININAGHPFSSGVGMASYPNFQGDCRFLAYPTVDLLYKACDEAQVDCGHVYLYRDPYAVLQSTTIHRHFNKDGILAMHLYTTMLQVIQTQLLRHPSRTLACVGLYDTELSWDERWGPYRDLFGWTNKMAFAEHLNTLYKPPSSLSEAQRQQYRNHKDEGLYMELFMKVHQEVLRLCRRQVHVNRM